MVLPMPTTGGQLGFSSAGLSLTPEEFLDHKNWEAGYRYELIHGVLVVAPTPSDAERGPSDYLGHLLWNYQEGPQGGHMDASFFDSDITIGDSVRRVDRAIWAGLGRYPDSRVDLPTILIEFLSPGKRAFVRDYEEKRDEYLGFGAKEYWVIDRFARQMTVYTGTPDNVATRIVSEQEIYTTPILPGFQLPLAKILAIADKSTQAQSRTDCG